MTRTAHDMTKLNIIEIRNNLDELCKFSTRNSNIFSDSKLTIRNGIFTKTSGKFDLKKRIVRNADDSLTDKERLEEIYECFNRYMINIINNQVAVDGVNVKKRLLYDAFEGFCNLAWQYKNKSGWDKIKKVLDRISAIIKSKAYINFLEDFNQNTLAQYSQNNYNQENEINTDGTCWALVADWCRRCIIKNKVTYAHETLLKSIHFDGRNKDWLVNQNLLRRGKLMPITQGIVETGVDKTFNMGVEIRRIMLNQKDNKQKDILEMQYKAGAKNKSDSFSRKYDKVKHTGDIIISRFVNRFCIGFGFYDEHINFIRDVITSLKTKQSNYSNIDNNIAFAFMFHMDDMFDGSHSAHACGFFYHRGLSRFYFMDPNYGDFGFVSEEQIKLFIFDLFKLYALNLRFISHIKIAKFENTDRPSYNHPIMKERKPDILDL